MRFCITCLIAFSVAVAGSACGHAPSGSVKPMPAPLSSNFAAATPIHSFSGQSRVTGEYLVTLVAGTDVKVISEVYGGFGIKSLRDLGAGLFQVNLGEDPGPEKMEALRGQKSGIKAIQPNFIYSTNSPAGGAQ